MSDFTTLSSRKKEILSKIAKKGADRAAQAISKLTNRQIDLKISGIRILPVEKMSKAVLTAETIVTTVYLKITGDIAGSILIIFPEKSALNIVDLLLGNKAGTTGQLEDYGKSILKEVSNIISGSYLAAFSDYLKLSLVESIPDLAVDMLQATVDSILIDFAKKGDYALSITMRFESSAKEITGHFFILFDTASAQIILNSLKENKV